MLVDTIHHSWKLLFIPWHSPLLLTFPQVLSSPFPSIFIFLWYTARCLQNNVAHPVWCSLFSRPSGNRFQKAVTGQIPRYCPGFQAIVSPFRSAVVLRFVLLCLSSSLSIVFPFISVHKEVIERIIITTSFTDGTHSHACSLKANIITIFTLTTGTLWRLLTDIWNSLANTLKIS